MSAVTEWQNRSLDVIYTIVFLDGIVFKVRKDGKVINKYFFESIFRLRMESAV